jgi:hypothetical protein
MQERTRGSVLIISHQAVLRCLYGYLMNRDLREVPFIPIPLNTVIQVSLLLLRLLNRDHSPSLIVATPSVRLCGDAVRSGQVRFAVVGLDWIGWMDWMDWIGLSSLHCLSWQAGIRLFG